MEEFDLRLVEYAIPAYYVIAAAEASSNLARFDGVKYGYRTEEHEGLHNMLQKIPLRGLRGGSEAADYAGRLIGPDYLTLIIRKPCRPKVINIQAFDDAFKAYDFLLGPVAPLRRCRWVRDCPTRWLCTWAIFIRL